ncbi:MAG: cation transporter [Bacteroidales bacterium]|nr:cation transporter [Bacteroidota bacterium]MBL6950010.1 cation transporter [Bacteroidales bacterium]
MSSNQSIESNELTGVNRAFIIGIILNLVFVVVEFGAGIYLNSLALISDAGHNLSDVASLSLAMLAFRLAKVKPNKTFTYGLRKSTILISLLNAIILLIVVGFIAWESVLRLKSTEAVEGDSMAVVAGVGILINTITALLFFKNRKQDLNIKGAFLHLTADALVSAGVVATGIVIGLTDWYWLDTAVSLAIVVVILVSTWGLLRDSTVLALDGVPRGIDPNKVKEEILQFQEVKNVHHIHIWAMSTTENALTAHITVADDFNLSSFEPLKAEIHQVLYNLKIQHSTLEIELESESCAEGIV